MTATPDPTAATSADSPGFGFWIGLAFGAPVMVYGAAELITQGGWPRFVNVVEWLSAGVLLHDLLLAPLVIAVIWTIRRLFPSQFTPPITAGILGTALIVAIGWPALRGYGNRPDNPTVHPLDYSTAVLTAIALVWILVAVWLLARALLRRQPHQDA